MVAIEYLKDKKGMASRGSCVACWRSAEDDSEMVRIKCRADNGYHRTHICLCSQCFQELKDEILELEEGER